MDENDFWHFFILILLPSGYVKIAIENDPVEIVVIFPLNMVDLSIVIISQESRAHGHLPSDFAKEVHAGRIFVPCLEDPHLLWIEVVEPSEKCDS